MNGAMAKNRTFSVKEKASVIKVASLTALAGNFILAGLKIFTGIFAHSMAVVGDGIDTSMDILIAIMTLVVSLVIVRPADKNHPWGHGRAETVATALLSMILFFAGGQLILSASFRLMEGKVLEIPGRAALIVTAVSIAGKILLSWSQYIFGKRAGSAMLKANAKNMLGDVVTSAGVLVGLGCSVFFNVGAVDLITAILVGIWVIKNAVGIFLEANMELMDGAADDKSYRELFEAVRLVPEAGHPHRTRMRRIAGYWDIDIDIEVDPSLTVAEAHSIASRVEDAVKERIEGIFDIMVHVEPVGNKQTEGYGLTEEHVK
ncbi:MAG: cation diffusion facilitator family transporter [Spirochaetaceae bacterium]|jgi:cation diffusion facilitator family transporter|nr:cation diffusion facilitator family transporter [Spirochaetaceae bacterium]